jgi:uncharacterized membrane protein YhaH (DUF805 family)
MGFGEAIRTCFRKYVTFSGRARRSEYWYFYLFTILAGMVASMLDAVVGGAMGATDSFRNTSGPFAALLNLAVLLPSIAVTVRRLHDTNHSGWLFGGFILYCVVAIAGAVGAGVAGAFGGPGGSGQANMPALMGAIALALIGVAYAIYIFVLMVWNGNAGANKYGDDPKGPNVEVFS